MSEPPKLLRTKPLVKTKSWSSNRERDAAWLERQREFRCGRNKSFTNHDLDELKGFFDLGFAFNSPDSDPKLSGTLPALDFYHAVSQSGGDSLSRCSSSMTVGSDLSHVSSSSSEESPLSKYFCGGDDPETMKTKLRHWAKVVACKARYDSAN